MDHSNKRGFLLAAVIVLAVCVIGLGTYVVKQGKVETNTTSSEEDAGHAADEEGAVQSLSEQEGSDQEQEATQEDAKEDTQDEIDSQQTGTDEEATQTENDQDENEDIVNDGEDTQSEEVVTQAVENDSVKQVMIYVPDEDAMNLIPQEVTVSDEPQDLIDALIKEQVLPEKTKLNQFVVYDADGKEFTGDYATASGLTATIDLSQEYLDQVMNTGTCGEAILIYSVVDTFMEIYNLDSVMLTGEGKTIETGHRILDEPCTFNTQL